MRAAVELQSNVLVTLGAGIADRLLRHRAFHGEFRHGIVAVAARQTVALVHGAQPEISRSARVAAEARAGLRLDRSARAPRIADDEALRERLRRMRRSRTMASLAYRNSRIR